MTKVFGGTLGGMHRAIVAAPTKIEVIRILWANGIHMSLHEFNAFWCVTGNPKEITEAMHKPGVVYVRSLREFNAPWEVLVSNK